MNELQIGSLAAEEIFSRFFWNRFQIFLENAPITAKPNAQDGIPPGCRSRSLVFYRATCDFHFTSWNCGNLISIFVSLSGIFGSNSPFSFPCLESREANHHLRFLVRNRRR